MADPLTALMYAVQVMNFLKTLIVKTIREREDAIVEAGPASQFDHFDENNEPHCSFQGTSDETDEVNNENQDFSVKEPTLESHENVCHNELTFHSQSQSQSQTSVSEEKSGVNVVRGSKSRNSQLSNSNQKKGLRKSVERSKGSTIVSRLNARTERIEAWR